MLNVLPQKFPIQNIVDQVNSMTFGPRLDLNSPSGKFFNDPWIIKDEFKGTPLGNVLESLGNIGQARLLKLESAESYTAHTDPDDRIHLAIVTNPYSYLIDFTTEQMHHIPADGRVWYMDTSRTHIAANWGPKVRIHLNVRVLLPHFDQTRPGIRITLLGNSVEWKQDSYIEIMGFINQQIKNGTVTGFEGVSDKELVLNCSTPDIFEPYLNRIRDRGVDLLSQTF